MLNWLCGKKRQRLSPPSPIEVRQHMGERDSELTTYKVDPSITNIEERREILRKQGYTIRSILGLNARRLRMIQRLLEHNNPIYLLQQAVQVLNV